MDVLDDALAPQLYPAKEDGSDPRKCPKCGNGQLHLKSSRTGGFVGCGNYPECKFTRPISGDSDETAERLLGDDHGDQIFLKSELFSNDGKKKFQFQNSGHFREAKEIGYEVGRELLKKAGSDFTTQEN